MVTVDTLIEKSTQSQSFFLDYFPLARRSVIANRFFAAAREGAETVDAVLRQVKAGAILRMVVARREQWSEEHKLLSVLETEEARVYVQEVLDRESLPQEEKWRAKQERHEHYRRKYLRAQSPTEKQLCFLKSLGCQTTPANRWEASEMIDGHVNR